MARIFNVVCPKCGRKFYAHWDDFRHKKMNLICPFCHHSFDQEDSPLIEE